MPVNDAASASSANPVPTNPVQAKNPMQLSPEEFFKIFTAQMKAQNPTKPMDNGVILQQMSSLTAVQTSLDMQQTIKELKNSINYTMGKTQMLNASQMIGRKVEVPYEKSMLVKGGKLDGTVVLPKAASDIMVTIKDSSGKVVAEIPLAAAKQAGGIDFDWNGVKDDKGNFYDAGEYDISATATIDGVKKPVATLGAYPVNSVVLDQQSNEVILNLERIGGVTLNDALKIL